MQNLIGQVVNVLREEETSVHYQLALDELAQLVATRVQPLAEQRGVHLTWTAGPSEPLSNRTANLVGFILVNLMENAVEATPSGGNVCLNINPKDPKLIFEVRDEGEGFPESATAELFTPRRSSKEGGSGIGLAICKQLATHLGAELELRSTTAKGSIIWLTLPLPAKAVNAGRNPVVRMS